MVSSCSQYNEGDCGVSPPVIDDKVHCSTPSRASKNVSIFAQLDTSFQSASTVHIDDHENDPDYMPDE